VNNFNFDLPFPARRAGCPNLASTSKTAGCFTTR